MATHAEVITATLTPEWIQLHEQRKGKLHIKDPWKDKLANKTGLNNIYISDTITDIMGLRAEKEPTVQLNCSNPEFEKYTKLFNNLMKTHKEKPRSVEVREQYDIFLCYIEAYSKQRIQVLYWQDYMPDIRVLDTLQECLSWLYKYLGLEAVALVFRLYSVRVV